MHMLLRAGCAAVAAAFLAAGLWLLTYATAGRGIMVFAGDRIYSLGEPLTIGFTGLLIIAAGVFAWLAARGIR